MSTKKKVWIMILIGVIYFVFDTLLQAGVFTQITNTGSKDIELLSNAIWGAEDMDVDYQKNRVFISSMNRWEDERGNSTLGNGIYVTDLNFKSEPEMFEVIGLSDFHPHGISFFRQDSVDYLYVVNHFGEKSRIELFKIESNSLVHVKSYLSSTMHSPNDVAGKEVDRFYVSVDHGNTSPQGKKMEEFLRMPYSYVLFYNGVEYIKVLKGLVYANGVHFSNNGQQLFVSETIGHELKVLDVVPESGGLVHKETIKIPSGMDNISVDEKGDIWVAGHPKLFDFLAHKKDSTAISPSQVFTISTTDNNYEVKKVFEDNGKIISGSSVAINTPNGVIIGSVYSNKIVRF